MAKHIVVRILQRLEIPGDEGNLGVYHRGNAQSSSVVHFDSAEATKVETISASVGTRLTFGRTEELNVRLCSHFVSRHHATLEFIQGRFQLTETNTSNGTIIGNDPEAEPVRGGRHAIHSGECFIIRPFVFQVTLEETGVTE